MRCRAQTTLPALALAFALFHGTSHAGVLLEEAAGLEDALHCKTPDSLHAMPDRAFYLGRLTESGAVNTTSAQKTFGRYAMISAKPGVVYLGYPVTAVVLRSQMEGGPRAAGLLLQKPTGESMDVALRRLFLQLKSRGYWFVQERFQPPLQYRLYQKAQHPDRAVIMRELAPDRILFGCFEPLPPF